MAEKEKKEKKPKSKARKTIEWVLTGIFLALFAVVGIAQIDGLIHKDEHYGQQIRFGFATFVVKTESMEPVYMVDSAIITYLEDVDKIYERYQNNETIDVTFYHTYTKDSPYTLPQNHPELTMRTKLKENEFPIITHRVQEIHIDPSMEKGQGKYVFIVAGVNKGVASATNSEGQIYQYQVFTEKELLGCVVVGSPFLGAVFSFVSSVGGLLILLLIPALYLIITSVIDIFKAYKDPEEEMVTSGGPSNSGKEVTLSEADKKRLKEELLQEMMNKKKGDK